MTTQAAIGKTRVTTGLAVPEKPRAWLHGLAIALLGLLVGSCQLGGEPANLAIWRIVDDGCNHAQSNTPGASAGLQCEAAQGYAILKDRCGPTHYLLLPTRRRSGVESAELLGPDEPNYFALAWAERGRSIAASARPARADADVALAVNSRYGRSQEQLHIHIDRLRPEVREALHALAQPVAPGTQIRLLGHGYRIDHVDDLGRSPFLLAAADWAAQTGDDRARLTIAVAGDGVGGFYVLSGRADLVSLDRGHAEELLVSHPCG